MAVHNPPQATIVPIYLWRIREAKELAPILKVVLCRRIKQKNHAIGSSWPLRKHPEEQRLTPVQTSQ